MTGRTYGTISHAFVRVESTGIAFDGRSVSYSGTIVPSRADNCIHLGGTKISIRTRTLALRTLRSPRTKEPVEASLWGTEVLGNWNLRTDPGAAVEAERTRKRSLGENAQRAGKAV